MCGGLKTEALKYIAFLSHDTGLGHVLCSVYATKYQLEGEQKGGTMIIYK